MMGLLANIFGSGKAVDTITGAVDKIVDLIPEGDEAKRIDAAKIARETLERLTLENSGDRIAQIIRAATRPILTIALTAGWLGGVQVEKIEIAGLSMGIGELAAFAIAFWFSERGILGFTGGKR